MKERLIGDRISWPGDARVAVALYFDFQGGEGVKLLPERNIHFEDYTKAEYGPKTGIHRILRILEERGITATFLTCGAIAERYPQAVEKIAAQGHEIGGHGFHHEIARNLSKEAEREIIGRTIEALHALTGKRPIGWRSCTQSPNTLDLLMEHEFLWNSNTFSYDLPIIYERGQQKIVELPRQPFGDGLLYGHSDSGNPRDALTVWQAAFNELYEEAKTAPVYCPFTFHPYISSRPGRAAVLTELISYMQNHPGVWFAKGSELALRCIEICEGK